MYPYCGRAALGGPLQEVSRHRSVQTVQGYVRDAELFEDHAAAGLL
jgi:hypothetical protein